MRPAISAYQGFSNSWFPYCFFDLSGKHRRITLAINGNGMPIKNHGQNFLPKLFAIKPAVTGNNSGISKKGIAKMTSISLFCFLSN